jgi:hypothetical protein
MMTERQSGHGYENCAYAMRGSGYGLQYILLFAPGQRSHGL